jgi:Vault protein inter-alpha-trypsin domain
MSFPFRSVSARVVLTQIYTNTAETSTSRAKYVFPVPSRAAVCGFEMHADGRVIVGVSKEKSMATEEHEAAIREGKFTGLLEWVTDDG